MGEGREKIPGRGDRDSVAQGILCDPSAGLRAGSRLCLLLYVSCFMFHVS